MSIEKLKFLTPPHFFFFFAMWWIIDLSSQDSREGSFPFSNLCFLIHNCQILNIPLSLYLSLSRFYFVATHLFIFWFQKSYFVWNKRLIIKLLLLLLLFYIDNLLYGTISWFVNPYIVCEKTYLNGRQADKSFANGHKKDWKKWRSGDKEWCLIRLVFIHIIIFL